ncbi:hypothetical protein Pcinc_026787 [Petrolisthes cinctipes]|uniref:Uncharacterized protein n=1 Tax=Petrolisthes cinctipes TaxID=88211 RepID=A0AAE1KBS5_PETCI|nr:hypothetical protein Pcinc_026787 [Petrolisthes cinctipes]
MGVFCNGGVGNPAVSQLVFTTCHPDNSVRSCGDLVGVSSLFYPCLYPSCSFHAHCPPWILKVRMWRRSSQDCTPPSLPVAVTATCKHEGGGEEMCLI